MAFRDLFRRKMVESVDEPITEAAPITEKEGAPMLIKPVTDKTVIEATHILNKYKQGKANLEQKIRSNEEFWKMRQWERKVDGAKPLGDNPYYNVEATAWLHTCIESRHADAMDSYPTCNFRARQQDDEGEAKILSAVMPVVLEQNDFENTYDKVSRYTLKNGTGVYGIFWDPKKHNGIGDISIRAVDILNLFTEPGITDLQASSNVFYTALMDDSVLNKMYPQTKNKLGGKSINTATYMYDDSVDTTGKSVVVDWYYKKVNSAGQRVLHYCKYVNDVVLFASENEPEYEEKGYYHHGLYPFEIQPLYPIEGTIFGYGLTDIGKSAQLDIDRLNKAIVDNAEEGAGARYFIKVSAGVNEEEFNDKTKKYVHVEGSLDDYNIRSIEKPQISGIAPSFLQQKVDELKFCTANQDVNNGVAPSGVTSASGIAALQETSGKNSRSSNRTFHRTFRGVIYQALELFRQFYDQPRQFRIAPDTAKERYITYSNKGLQPIPQSLGGMDMGFRVPEFDIQVTVEKANPYKKMEHNELMLQFYNLGLFNPQNTDQAIALLTNMDFEGKDKIIQQIRQNGTMMDMLVRFQQLSLQLAQGVDPNMAHDIAGLILQSNGGNAPVEGAADIEISEEGKEHPFVEKSRAQARAATQAE